MLLNYNNMNNNCNPWYSLLQQGLYSLGGGDYSTMMGMGGSIFNCGMYGNNYFTNCMGEVDYNAVAGYGVISAVVNAGIGLVSSYKTEKAEQAANQIDYDAEIKNIADEIAAKTEIKTNVMTVKADYDKLYPQLTKCDGELSSAETEFNLADASLKSANDALAQDPNNATKKQNAKDAEKRYSEASEARDKIEKAKKELENKIEAQKKALEKYSFTIDTYNEDLKGLENEIKALETKKKIYINAKNAEQQARELDDADGNRWTRTSDKKFRNKYLKEDGTLDTNRDYTERDFHRAVLRFSEANDGVDKYKAAKVVVDMYDKEKFGSSTYGNAKEHAQAYIKAHPELKSK